MLQRFEAGEFDSLFPELSGEQCAGIDDEVCFHVVLPFGPAKPGKPGAQTERQSFCASLTKPHRPIRTRYQFWIGFTTDP